MDETNLAAIGLRGEAFGFGKDSAAGGGAGDFTFVAVRNVALGGAHAVAEGTADGGGFDAGIGEGFFPGVPFEKGFGALGVGGRRNEAAAGAEDFLDAADADHEMGGFDPRRAVVLGFGSGSLAGDGDSERKIGHGPRASRESG